MPLNVDYNSSNNPIKQLNNIYDLLYGGLSQILEQQTESKNKKLKEKIEEQGNTELYLNISGDTIGTLQTILKSEGLKDKLSDVASGLEVLNKQIEKFESFKVSNTNGIFFTMEEFFNSISKIDPTKIKELDANKGKTINDFFKVLLDGMSIKSNSKDLKNNIKNISSLIDFINVNSDKISEIGQKIHQEDVDNINKYFSTLFEAFDNDKLKNLDKLQNFTQFLKKTLSLEFIARIRLGSLFLSEKSGERIGNFYKAILNPFNEEDIHKMEIASKIMQSSNELIKELTKSIALLAAISMIAAATNPIGTVFVLSFIVGGMTVLMRQLAKISNILNKAEGIDKTIDSMASIITALSKMILIISASTVIMSLAGGAAGLLETLALMVVSTIMVIGIILLISKNSEALDQAKDGISSLNNLIITLVSGFILIAITSMLLDKFGGWDGILFTLVLMTIVVGVLVALVALLGSKFMQKDIKQGIDNMTKLTVVIGLLTLNILLLAITGYIVKAVGWETLIAPVVVLLAEVIALGILAAVLNKIGMEILRGEVMLIACLVGLSLAILLTAAAANLANSIKWSSLGKITLILIADLGAVLALSWIGQTFTATGGFTNLAIVIGCLAGLSLVLFMTIAAAKYSQQVSLEDIGFIALILGGLLVAITALAGITNLIKKEAIQTAILIGCLAGLVLILAISVKVAKYARQTKAEDWWRLAAIFEGMIVALAVLGGLGALMSTVIPAIGLLELCLGGLVGLMAAIVAVVTKYAEAKAKYGDLSKIGTEIAGAFTGFVNGIANGISPVNFLKTMIISVLTTSFLPLMITISKFVDIINKVASLTFITGYDDNKKPIYEKVDSGTWSSAATAVTNGFTLFIQGLGNGFKSMSLWSIIAIKALSDNLEPVMKSVSEFVDAVMKIATGTYKISDEDDPTKTKIMRVTADDFNKAAVAVTDNFGVFLTGLIDSANNLGFFSSDALEAISDNISPVMNGVSKFVDAIMKVATGTYTITDANGNNITKHLDPNDFTTAATKITDNFSDFITNLISTVNGLNGDVEDALEALGDTLGPIMDGVGNYIEAIMKVATGVYKYTGVDGKTKIARVTDLMFTNAAKNTGHYFLTFVKSIRDNFSKMTDDQTDAIKALSEGVGPLMKQIGTFADAIFKLASGTYVSGYKDINGEVKPIYTKIPDTAYTKAASVLTTMFTNFISGLQKNLGGISEQASDVLEELNDGGIKDVMEATAKFVKMITDNMWVIKGYDSQGNPIFYKDKAGHMILSSTYFPQAGKSIAQGLVSFITNLSNNLSKSNIVANANKVADVLNNLSGVFTPLQKLSGIIKESSQGDWINKAPNIGRQLGLMVVNLFTSLDPYVKGKGDFLQIYGIDKTADIHGLAENTSTMLDTVKKFEVFLDTDFETIHRNENEYLNIMSTLLTYDTINNSYKFIQGTNNIIKALHKLDNAFIKDMNTATKSKNTISKMIDQINDKLSEKEDQRNRQLTTLTKHFDNIGKKLQIINKGLAELATNDAGTEKLTELAQQFANMQASANEGLVNMIVQSQASNPQPTTPQSTNGHQSNSNNNSGNVYNMINGGDDGTYFKEITVNVSNNSIRELANAIKNG